MSTCSHAALPQGVAHRPQSNVEHPHRFGLDALRALAIALVLLEHGQWFPYNVLPYFSLGFPAGYLGVELFFVLSGYLVGGMALDAADSLSTWRGLRSFWRRRWFRTLPNYALFLILIWSVDGWLGRWRPESPLAWATFTQNLAWPVPHWFRASWSLAIEEWFYLLLPASLGFLLWRGASTKRAAGLAIGLAILLPLLLRVLTVAVNDTPFWDTRMIVALHMDPIGWGVLAAAVHRWRPATWAKLERFALVGLAGLIACSLWFSAGSPERFSTRTVFPSLVSASIALTLPWLAAWKVQESPGARGVRAVARWSYSMYLVDGVIYPVMFLWWPGFPTTVGQGFGYMGLYFVGVTACAAATHRLWERPWLRLRDQGYARSSGRISTKGASSGVNI